MRSIITPVIFAGRVVTAHSEETECTDALMERHRPTVINTNDDEDDDHRVFRAWPERWEGKKIGKNGCAVLEARLAKKYGGLKWWDIDEPEEGSGKDRKKGEEPPRSLRTAHPTKMYFTKGGKGEGKNRYSVIGMKEGFDLSKSLEDNDDYFDVWDRNEDFFGQIVEYYEHRPEVKCYPDGGECASDEE